MTEIWVLVVVHLAAWTIGNGLMAGNRTGDRLGYDGSTELELFGKREERSLAKTILLWIALLLLIGIPIIVVILFWCLTQAYREVNFARPATPSDASTEEEELDLEAANDPIRNTATSSEEVMSDTVRSAPRPPSVMEFGQLVPPVDQSLSHDEQLDAIFRIVIRKHRQFLKEPYQTNTDILPMDDWHDDAPKLRMDTMLQYLPIHLAKILIERQARHLSHLTEQLEELQRDEEKYHSLNEDEKHMANVKENRFETMIELLNSLQESVDECLFVDAASRWGSQENGKDEINETSL